VKTQVPALVEAGVGGGISSPWWASPLVVWFLSTGFGLCRPASTLSARRVRGPGAGVGFERQLWTSSSCCRSRFQSLGCNSHRLVWGVASELVCDDVFCIVFWPVFNWSFSSS
jgi:hypothetical protein